MSTSAHTGAQGLSQAKANALPQIASDTRHKELKAWALRASIPIKSKPTKDDLVTAIVENAAAADPFTPSRVAQFIETNKFPHQALETLREGLGIPVILFRAIVDRGRVCFDGGFMNHVVPYVDKIVGGAQGRELAGLTHMTEGEKRQAGRLMRAEGLNDLKDIAAQWGQPIQHGALEAVWTLTRWAFGLSLGYLNYSGDGMLQVKHLLQLPDWTAGNVRFPRRRQQLQTLMWYRWFTDPVHVEDLQAGIAPRPFDPVHGGLWDSVERNSEADARCTDEALVQAATRHSVTIAQALKAIEGAPFVRGSWVGPDSDFGTRLMIDIITHLRQQNQTAFGPLPIIWRLIHRFFEVRGRECGHKYIFSAEETQRLGDSKFRKPAFTPADALEIAPGACWWEIEYLMDTKISELTSRRGGIASNKLDFGGEDEEDDEDDNSEDELEVGAEADAELVQS